MAEFVEIVRQYNRMCESYKNVNCAHYPMPFVHVVEQWAEENPESVYPTWRDWLRGQYSMIGPYTMPDILDSPIPADIAEKLGVVPKENG